MKVKDLACNQPAGQDNLNIASLAQRVMQAFVITLL